MTATEPSRHAIGDLARLAGVTPRTIRYYVAQGLLPAPTGAGPGAHYDARHLERLRLIRRLQRQHLPLAEIRARLTTLDDDQVAALNRTGVEDQAPASSALDYIRSVLGGAGVASPPEGRAPMPAPMAAPIPAPGAIPKLLRRAMPTAAKPDQAPVMALRETRVPEPPAASPEPTIEPNLERSQWERLSLGPNLELHIRRPLSRHEQRRVERLITIARQVLKEELP